MDNFGHVADKDLREFLNSDDPTKYDWNAVVGFVDAVEQYAQADQHNPDVSFKNGDNRMASYYNVESALGQRNRYELQDAVREFFLA